MATGALLLSIAPAALAASPVVPPSKSSGTIVGIASSMPETFSTLVEAVGCADPAVAATLTSGEQLTVFAPTNDAFGALLAALDANDICDLPQSVVTSVLLYHVEGGRHFSNSVLPRKTGQVKTIGTLLGQTFKVDASGTIATTGGITTPHIVTPNIPAANGVIHVVDAVLVPALR
jgi:transforming growth factor-beta-induced protein